MSEPAAPNPLLALESLRDAARDLRVAWFNQLPVNEIINRVIDAVDRYDRAMAMIINALEARPQGATE